MGLPQSVGRRLHITDFARARKFGLFSSQSGNVLSHRFFNCIVSLGLCLHVLAHGLDEILKLPAKDDSQQAHID